MSQTQLQELIDTAKRPEEKIAWQNELGEISRERYWTSQDTSELKKSQEAFEQADNLFRSLPPEKQEGPLGSQQIVNLCIAAAAAREANDHEKSAMLFQSARKLFQTSNENAKHAVLSRYDLEVIAEQEMFEWIPIKREAEALQCLEILTSALKFLKFGIRKGVKMLFFLLLTIFSIPIL